MENLILVVHVIIAICIIGLILLQQGKGAEMGASFGSGASQTVFGSTGSGNFFSRMTAVLATVFFVTSFSLAILARQANEPGSIIPAGMQQSNGAVQEQDSDIPTVDEPAQRRSTPESDVPTPPTPDID